MRRPRQVKKGADIPPGFRTDIVVSRAEIVEVKANRGAYRGARGPNLVILSG